MSKVIDGHNTELDFICRQLRYESLDKAVQGDSQAIDNGYLEAARKYVRFALAELQGDKEAMTQSYDGGTSLDFIDDFIKTFLKRNPNVRGSDFIPHSINELRKYDEALNQRREMSAQQNNDLSLFREMADNARDDAESARYLERRSMGCF